eukprot:scaffold27068_cov18-Tisochrysis_lutea.AAC.2
MPVDQASYCFKGHDFLLGYVLLPNACLLIKQAPASKGHGAASKGHASRSSNKVDQPEQSKTDEATAANMPLDRTHAHTALYAAGCAEVAQEMGATCVDLYGLMQQTQVGAIEREEKEKTVQA